jgi:dihydrofolate synthase/folylpolyglutamate synthase
MDASEWDLSMKTYATIVKELESLGIMPNKAPSLVPMQKALARILRPDQFNSQKTIVVAGTNGKGSVCATLEALFFAAGETVGLYTSPHLEETTERIRLGGQDVSQELFCKAYTAVSAQTADLKLTHFETLTAMAAWLFFSGHAVAPVDRPIFEVGLGGLWDATNAIPHDLCIITSLGYDHQNLLGHSLEEIASNKFGIVGHKAKVVYSSFPAEASSKLAALARASKTQTQSTWIPSRPYSLKVEQTSRGTPHFELETAWGPAQLKLPGERSAQNTATALTAFAEFGYDPKRYLAALGRIRWPGRMEEIPHAKPCPIYLSGDHNVQGAESLVDLLRHYQRRHLYILAGIGLDKDLDGIMSVLFTLEKSSIFLTETPFKGRSIHDYGRWTQQAQGTFQNPLDGLSKIQTLATESDLIVITGSLYLIGAIRPKLLMPLV